MAVTGAIREWHDDEGWGVIDSPETPGGCWAGFMLAAVPGFASFTAGQAVSLEWESPGQDGWPYRAVRFWPQGQEPVDRFAAETRGTGAAYRSILTLSFDDPPDPGRANG
jgi:cold shock protein